MESCKKCVESNYKYLIYLLMYISGQVKMPLHSTLNKAHSHTPIHTNMTINNKYNNGTTKSGSGDAKNSKSSF